MVNLFAISQSETLSSSFFYNFNNFCLRVFTFVSLTNKIEYNKSDDLAKQLTLRINSRGPNNDLCGTHL